ncbi:GntR family transcriptional regulator [Pontibacter diazotrophicus]|uniref:GntR family transcriptional regulator n=1 Tax=Pontibacter diazotrophicus TaxID=1400979 RepID=A0A3D8LHX7_9BACT|nr:S1-like domain-containing RNA-binding protein [Pontibacter diazotrophicus]RDV17050.1 GntR family transcriptional regulator [Pontibacter diazotrophicus]
MVELGNYNELEIAREVDFGVYLTSEDGDILLPAKYIPKGAQVGDTVRVFVYRDSEDRIIATDLEPYATVGEFACLTCTDTAPFGAFLEWGLEKDLLVPLTNQKDKMQVGRKYCVYLYLDETSDRVVATTKLGKYLQNEDMQLTEGEEVQLLVAGFTDIGIKVIINNAYMGMLYQNEVFQDLQLGDKTTGYIKAIRPDNKVDVTLRKPNATILSEADEASEKIIGLLKQGNGWLPLSDSSTPEDIYKTLGMSKKTFKRAIGGLYKAGKIQLEEGSIRLK